MNTDQVMKNVSLMVIAILGNVAVGFAQSDATTIDKANKADETIVPDRTNEPEKFEEYVKLQEVKKNAGTTEAERLAIQKAIDAVKVSNQPEEEKDLMIKSEGVKKIAKTKETENSEVPKDNKK